MPQSTWLDFYSSMENVPSWGTAVERPTDNALDAFETHTGFRLPSTYKECVKVFGPGQLAHQYNLRSPGYTLANEDTSSSSFRFFADLESFNEIIRREGPIDNDTLTHCFPEDAERLSRLVYFADTSFGEIIGWDPDDLREMTSSEYGIYILVREMDHLTFLTDNFSSFVHEVCFGTRYEQITSPSATTFWTPPRSFRPMALPERKKV